jgi:hypothetical protein
MLFADVLSVLGMVVAHDTRDCMKYKLQGNRKELGEWGHEYVRHLAGEISEVVFCCRALDRTLFLIPCRCYVGVQPTHYRGSASKYCGVGGIGALHCAVSHVAQR